MTIDTNDRESFKIGLTVFELELIIYIYIYVYIDYFRLRIKHMLIFHCCTYSDAGRLTCSLTPFCDYEADREGIVLSWI